MLPSEPAQNDTLAGSDEEMFVDGRSIRVDDTFFRGPSTVFHPRRAELELPDGISRFFLAGWVPEASAAQPGQRALMLGCGITGHLMESVTGRGLVALEPPPALAAGLSHAHGIARLAEGALGDGDRAPARENLAALADAIGSADLIVICPEQAHYPLEEAAGTITPDHARTVEDFGIVYRLLRGANKAARIVFAISPLPVVNSPYDYAPIVASIREKATLRSAADEIYRQHRPADDRLHYFPAFELIQVAINHPFEEDRRRLRPHAIDLLKAAFAQAFAPGMTDDALSAAHVAIRAADVEVAFAMVANPPVPDATSGGDWPDEARLAADATLDDTLFRGLLPDRPFVDADSTLIAFGSCFANNISRYLNSIGYNVATRRDTIAYVARLGDGIVNTYAIRQQFEWAWEGRIPQVEAWHDYGAAAFDYDEIVRLRTRELFDQGDVFIITLGLSEVWFDEPTGEVFWRAVPARKYDPLRHKFRMISQAESRENLEAIYQLIRRHRPEARIVFTVSPIPLTATFRGAATIVASAVSKAILRSAVGEFFEAHRATDPDLFYFPTYETITGSLHQPCSEDLRHPCLHTIVMNMKIFERHFCDSNIGDGVVADYVAEVRRRDLVLGGPDRNAFIETIKAENALWADDQPACIESIARIKAREEVTIARSRARENTQQARQQETTAKREQASSAREAAAEERRQAAEQRRRDAEVARAARSRSTG